MSLSTLMHAVVWLCAGIHLTCYVAMYQNLTTEQAEGGLLLSAVLLLIATVVTVL